MLILGTKIVHGEYSVSPRYATLLNPVFPGAGSRG